MKVDCKIKLHATSVLYSDVQWLGMSVPPADYVGVAYWPRTASDFVVFCIIFRLTSGLPDTLGKV